ncbi:hypothetical protein [Nocardioides sp.]|uniref:hypothetical protein n=1 Tax=Nocardioides sp. TaxID=35761 RepID=UPI002ED908D7
MTRRATRSLGLAVALMGIGVTMAGCGHETGTAADASNTVSTADYLITSEALPRGWGDSNSQGVDYRVSVCGVDLEPTPPVRATSIRFSEGPLGPFLEQHVRVYDSDVTSGVIDRLREALPGCSAYTVTGRGPDKPTARFTVEPLTVDGAPADSVAWRQTSHGRLPVTSDFLLVRRGDAAVMLMSYAIRHDPDPRVLEQAAAALPEGQ